MPKSIHQREYQLFIQTLRRVREKAGVTQAVLSEQLGRPQSFVAKYESGERRLDVVELRQICLLLGLSLGNFVKRLEKVCKGEGL